MKRRLLGLVCLALALPAGADKVIMKDGRVYDGQVVDQNDKELRIRTLRGGTVTVLRDQVEKIETGESVVEKLDAKLTALSPDAPAAYLEVAEWCLAEKAADEELVRRLANTAMGLDPKLCGRGNLLLGNYLASKEDRAGAAEYYVRAFLADWENEVIRAKIDGFKGELEGRNRRQMRKLADALTLALNGKLADAVRELRNSRSAPYANLVSSHMPEHKTIDSLIEELQARIPCPKCNAKNTIACMDCEGAGKLNCPACGGDGFTEINRGGRGPEKVTCDKCVRGRVSCPRCKATPGKVACTRCRGLAPPVPKSPVNRPGLTNFRAAIESRLSGNLPIEEQVGPKMPLLGLQVYDDDYVVEGQLVYRSGKWVAPEPK